MVDFESLVAGFQALLQLDVLIALIAGTVGGIGNQDELIAMGYNFISLGADVVALSAYFKNIVDNCTGKDAVMP